MSWQYVEKHVPRIGGEAMQFVCPFCSGLFEVEPTSIGQHVTCPSCTGIVLVPAPSLPYEMPTTASPTVAPIVVPTFKALQSEQLALSPTTIDFGEEPARVASRLLHQQAQRRMIRNVFWMCMGLIVLIIMAVILVRSQ
jgi:hypothetical protein